MSPIERFTRDGASKYVWTAVALAALIGLAYATTAGSRAVDDQRAASQDRAVRYVEQVLDPRLGSRDLVVPITGVEGAVRRSILTDTGVSRVRVWSADGMLLFSTDQSDRPGSDAGLNDPVLREAERVGPITRSDFSDSGGANDPERSLLRTYVPLRGSAVAEIDQTDAGRLGPVRTEWRGYQILAGVLLLLSLVMIGLSLREPIEPINTGVPFADSSIPAGFSVIDDDRLHSVHEVYRLASERVARLQEKLGESEEARRRLEGQIQQVLSKAGESAPRLAAAAAETPAPAPAPEAPPALEPTVVQVPESDVVVTSPSGGAWADAPAGPLARAARDQKTVPVTSRKKKPPVVKPKRAPKKPTEKPAPVQPAAAPPVAEKPRPAPEPERRVEPAPKPAASTPAPAPVAARASTPAQSSPARQVDDATAHAAALETFIRLTESDRRPHDTTTVDQGAVRAALARTAARKKPGGERLQLPESNEESPGGPPPGRD